MALTYLAGNRIRGTSGDRAAMVVPPTFGSASNADSSSLSETTAGSFKYLTFYKLETIQLLSLVLEK